jgi:hypothetical protein
MKGSRKASNKVGRLVSWQQGQRRWHGKEGTDVGPITSENALAGSLAPLPVPPERNRIPPAADPAQVARLAL